MGRPISNGFAIVAPHDNLPDSDVSIGASQQGRQAASGMLGPALVSDMSPYSPARVPYDVSNLPVGYDLGAGAFDLQPAYKSGYTLTVGSDYTVTAFGTLVDDKGEPVTLLTGTAQEEGRKDGPTVTVFTNKAGKFGAQGLRPGRWLLDMATEPKTRYLLEIPKDAVGLVRLETLKPAGVAP
jgi:outer membrane usher protein